MADATDFQAYTDMYPRQIRYSPSYSEENATEDFLNEDELFTDFHGEDFNNTNYNSMLYLLDVKDPKPDYSPMDIIVNQLSNPVVINSNDYSEDINVPRSKKRPVKTSKFSGKKLTTVKKKMASMKKRHVSADPKPYPTSLSRYASAVPPELQHYVPDVSKQSYNKPSYGSYGSYSSPSLFTTARTVYRNQYSDSMSSESPIFSRLRSSPAWSNMDSDTVITPEMSADISKFPAPNPERYNINTVIWKYPDPANLPLEDPKNILKPDIEEIDGVKEYNCPITMDVIQEMAMTCHGHIYEKSAIEEWLQKNNTDPMTGKVIYTKTLITKGIDKDNIQAEQIRVRDMMRQLWHYPVELFYPAEILSKISKTKQRIANFNDEEAQAWTEYETDKKYHFQNPDYSKCSFPVATYLDENDNYTRPEGTGYGFEYIDLSCPPDNKYQHSDCNCKSTSFNGADLSNNVFIQCRFNRCTFISTDLSGCIFQNCTFAGEEVNFTDAKTSTETNFIDCQVEDIGNWNLLTDQDDVKKALNHRNLAGKFIVTYTGGDSW